jgi:hypothetical protein
MSAESLTLSGYLNHLTNLVIDQCRKQETHGCSVLALKTSQAEACVHCHRHWTREMQFTDEKDHSGLLTKRLGFICCLDRDDAYRMFSAAYRR